GGAALPPFGRVAAAAGGLILCVRPGRWLALGAATAVAANGNAVVDLSSALCGFHVAGPRVREALARSCRLDLDPREFPADGAARTIIAQVSAIVAALPSGLLLLTPSTTARHFHEWIAGAARPFGVALMPAAVGTDFSRGETT
ncbi:MAG: hypothetical protein KGL92_14085, partial [Gammaproteobacteria bacterium]|nr:hypothetical protein [Gammaproteobacteria bacterium]